MVAWRAWRLALCALLVAFTYAGDAGAADLAAQSLLFGAPASGGIDAASRWELRAGAYAHDPIFNERGSVDFTAEVVFPRLPITVDPAWAFLVPRPHIGGVANLRGRTSYGYTGFVWTIDITRKFFVEPIFGAMVHDGKLNTNDPSRDSLGCRVLFHTGVSAGYRLTDNWSVLATWEHGSNANTCARNIGINVFGGKVGYTF
ncbi:MAG: acyloxyacyl hydrolase [Proteobacteria bacterium]|nr:acyloxyacyl hydrolase [Pseudomonadota bacterium]